MERGKSFRDYVTEYQCKAKNDQIDALCRTFGLDEWKLCEITRAGVSEATVNGFGRFDELKNTVDRAKAKTYFESIEGSGISPIRVNIQLHNLLQKFLLSGGFDIEWRL